MTTPDLNLLVTLDILLAEGSVARAAERLRLSPSAMSRALARLREATGDPLLVRAGRGLVPTPRALELRAQIGPLVEQAKAMLRPAENFDLGALARTFTIRTRDGFAENFGSGLIAQVARKAPGVRLRFVAKLDRRSAGLRDGSIDLETGVVGEETSPELRAQLLFRDRFIGVVRGDHPLAGGTASAKRYAAGRHVLVSRRGHERGRVDDALEAAGLTREIAAIVDGFSAALRIARHSDLIATVPEQHTRNLRVGMASFALPVTVPEIGISLIWHPRMDADPAHRWLRGIVREVCGGYSPSQ